MTCKEAIWKLSYETVDLNRGLRQHLKNCGDCRLLVKITGKKPVLGFPEAESRGAMANRRNSLR